MKRLLTYLYQTSGNLSAEPIPQAEVPREAGTDDAGCRLRQGLGINALNAVGGQPSTSAAPTSTPPMTTTTSTTATSTSTTSMAPLQTSQVVSPPVLLSIVDMGVDYTQILQNLIILGLRHTEAEVMWWSETTLQEKRLAIEKNRNLWNGLSNRFTYLEAPTTS